MAEGYSQDEGGQYSQLLLVHLWQDIADVIPRVPVQPLLEPLLIEEVADEPDAASEHKHPIQ